jgi:hypothetical protein
MSYIKNLFDDYIGELTFKKQIFMVDNKLKKTINEMKRRRHDTEWISIHREKTEFGGGDIIAVRHSAKA